VDYLHNNNIIHRDLKPSNILITDKYNLKICDFNTSKILEIPDFKEKSLHTQIGTPFYMSPECVDNRKYNFKTDIWSIGCILYELMELEIAFNCNHIGRLLIKIHSGKYNKFKKAKFYTRDLREIVKKCVNKDENKRPNTLQLIEYPVFANSPFTRHINTEELEINTLQSSIIPKSIEDFKKVLKKYYKPLRKTPSNTGLQIDTTKSLIVSQMKIENKP
jgi:serine/threonine protein kinase